MATATETARSPEREWWLRLPLVLQAPRAVFAALRDDSDKAAGARQEPVLAVIVLAGIAVVLSTDVAASILDDFEIDTLVLAVWAFLAGALHGLAAYFVVGALVYIGLQLAGSLGTFRRARHLLAFAAAPLALSLVVWPVRLALYGTDAFTSGGSDSGAGGRVFEGIELAFLGWTAALLVIGIRTVEGWTWPRTLAAAALPLAVPALALARAYGVI